MVKTLPNYLSWALIVLALGWGACETEEETLDRSAELIGTWYLKYFQVDNQRFYQPLKAIINADGSGIRYQYDFEDDQVVTEYFNWEFQNDSLLIYSGGELLFRSLWQRENNVGRHTYVDEGKLRTDVYVLGTDTIDARFIGKWVLINQTLDGTVVPALRTIYFAAQGQAEAYHFEPYEDQDILHDNLLWQVSPGHLIVVAKDEYGQPDIESQMVFESMMTSTSVVNLKIYDEQGKLCQFVFMSDPGTWAPDLVGSYNLTAIKINGNSSPVSIAVQLNLANDGTGSLLQGSNSVSHTWSVNGNYLFMYLATRPHLTYPFQYTLSGNNLTLTWSEYFNGAVYTYEYTYTRTGQ